MGPEARERKGVERAPVDRDREARANADERFGGARGIEMAPPKSGSPAPDRQKSDVDRASKLAHLGEQIGVPGEVQARRAGDPVAQRRRLRTERPPASIMVGAQRVDPQRPDVELFVDPDLEDVATSHHRAEAAWHHDSRPPSETANRGGMQVIVVSMRDEDDVDLDVVEEMRDGIGVAVERTEPIHEDRVGEDTDAIDLEQDGRVPEIAKGAHRASVMRRS